jgi:hypothetical protein
VAKWVAKPKEYDWGALKRVARYLKGKPRAVQHFGFQDAPAVAKVYTDSDWAGDRESRKSTSGGAIMMGSNTIKTWSSTQQVIATSSGEAELYALTKGAAQLKGFMAMMCDFGILVEGVAVTDATAAIGIVHRQGLGKLRHIDVQYLWVQLEVSEGRLRVDKIGTTDNPADLLTKALNAETVEKHMNKLGIETHAECAETALKLANLAKAKDGWISKRPWQRRHDTPRRALFTPMRVVGGPANAGSVGSTRVTTGKYATGKTFVIEDNWRTTSQPHRLLGGAWTGTTCFS